MTFTIVGEYPLDWRLGFADGNVVWFFEDDPKDIYYDDWDDAPAYCNAVAPYGDKHRFFSVSTWGPLRHYEGRPYYSAQEYNSERPPAPWLCTGFDAFDKKLNVGVYGRTTFADFLRICKEVGQRVLLPVEWEAGDANP